MKKKTARRWLNRNSWKIACFRRGVLSGKQKAFIKQWATCLKAVK